MVDPSKIIRYSNHYVSWDFTVFKKDKRMETIQTKHVSLLVLNIFRIENKSLRFTQTSSKTKAVSYAADYLDFIPAFGIKFLKHFFGKRDFLFLSITTLTNLAW